MRSPAWTAAASADEPTEPDSTTSDPATSDPAAQTEEVIQTEEVVVSATKTPVPVSQVTSAVEVITEQDMKKQNIRDRRACASVSSRSRERFRAVDQAQRSTREFVEQVRVRRWC